MSISKNCPLASLGFGLCATALLGTEVEGGPAIVKTDSGYEIRLEGAGLDRRLDSQGSVVRGEPWVFEDRAAWIEETTETATVRVWTGTDTIVLATSERGRLLDPAIGSYGVAWSRFVDNNWQIELTRDGEGTVWGQPEADDILPVVGETGIAWIGTRGVEVWVYTTLGGSSKAIRLPGPLAERLRCSGDTLSWFSGLHPRFNAWTYENGVTRDLGTNRMFRYARAPAVGRETPTVPFAEPLSPEVTWELIPIENPKPDHRTTHAFLSIGEGMALVFAGEIWDSGTGLMKGLDSETWILDLENRAFTKIEPEGERPSPRCHTPLVFDPTRHLALTFGGGGYDPERGVFLLGDTWLFDTQRLVWSRVETQTTPGPDSDAGLVYDSVADRFVMYRRGEVWEFKVADRDWKKLAVSPGPAPRTCSSLVFDPIGNRILLWGGALHPKYFEDTWLLNLETGTWKEIRGVPRPAPRARSALAYDRESRCAVAYGGVRGPHSERFEDLWRFDFKTEKWELLESQNPASIGKRGGFFGMPRDDSTGDFFLFGGRSDSGVFHNDLWRLHIGQVKERSE